MKQILSLAFILMLLTGCVKTFDKDELSPLTGMEKLVVLDGFTYSSNYDTDIDLTFSGNNTHKIYFDIMNGTVEEGASVLFNDVFTTTYHRDISLPLHIKTLSVVARYTNRIKTFQMSNTNGFDLTLTADSFKPGVDTTQNTALRVSNNKNKGKNCLPDELGAYFPEDLSWSNDYLAAYSSKDIDNVVIRYDDDSEIKIEDPNIDYGNTWYIHVNATKAIVGVWIKSGCNESEDGPGYGWYVDNPHYEVVKDTDGDGVEDALDAAPNDPDVATIVYYPAKDEYTTFAFEDLWPYQGDYDFNDFVVSSNQKTLINASGMVTGVDYNFIVRAIGASFSNDFCLSISDPNNTANVTMETEEDIEMTIEELDNLTEIRFPAIKDVFGSVGFVNTQTDKTALDVKSFNLSIRLDGTVTYAELKTDQYLRINQEEGREVHLPGKVFTSLANEALFQTGHDDTHPASGKYYLTTKNLPWAIEVPYEWAYPSEGSLILDAYPKFKQFAEGDTDLAWYTSETGNIVEKYIYK